MEHDENSISTLYYIYGSGISTRTESQSLPQQSIPSSNQSITDSQSKDESICPPRLACQQNPESTTMKKTCKKEEWTVIEHNDILIDNPPNIIDQTSENDPSLSKKLQETVNNTMIYPVIVPEVKMNDIDLAPMCCKKKEACSKENTEQLSLNTNPKNTSTSRTKQYRCTIF